MANANTDLTEEDATDLQFPKELNDQPTELSVCSSKNLEVINNLVCLNCSHELVAPYIYCVPCEINICANCFSQGVELLNHKSDHDYRIIRDDFSLFSNTDWTAKEEVILLDSIQRLGSWELVASQLPKRTIPEITRHYNYIYLDRHGSKDLPEIEDSGASKYPEPVVPYRFKIDFNEEPPRYCPNTVGYVALAGYNPARSDFESEFDSNAEDLLTKLKPIESDDPDSELLSRLQCSIISSYNRRLLERQRWKKIIKDHGLIVLRKVNAWLHRYDLTITRPVYEKLIHFMQFCTPFQFESLMEGLHHSGELKIQMLRLCELRQKGIKSLADARFYLKLKNIHEKNEFDLKTLHSNPQFNWKANKGNLLVDLPCMRKKVRFKPIDVIGMPGYEKLLPSERELCRNVRLVPITYLELKDVLINENKKLGSLKLKTARKMLKIDVNKTRKLYDFLVQEGYIQKPAS